MKTKLVYKLAGMLLLFIILQSRSGGPGSQQNLQVTGAPGSSGNAGTCGNIGCHSGGNYNSSLSLSLLDGALSVTSYSPGKNYVLRVVNTPSSGTPAGYGFQAVSLNDSGNQSGDWGSLPSGTHTTLLGAKNFVEHNQPASSGTFNIPWQAPAKGSGRVTFYSASLASNLDGSTFGDHVSTNSLTISEGSVTNSEDIIAAGMNWKIVGNQVKDELVLELQSVRPHLIHISVLDLNGKRILSEGSEIQAGLNNINLNLSNLLYGLYVVRISGKGINSSGKFIKL